MAGLRFWLGAGLGLYALSAAAEDDGREMLEIMMHPQGRAVAAPYVNIVWRKWDGTLFCVRARVVT